MSKWEIENVKWKNNIFLPRWGGCRVATGGVQQLNPLPRPTGEGCGEVLTRRAPCHLELDSGSIQFGQTDIDRFRVVARNDERGGVPC